MTWAPSASALIQFLDAVYQIDQGRDAWIRNILQAALLFERGAGIAAVLYDVSSGTDVRTDFIEGIGLPSGWLEAGIALHRDPALAAHIIAGYRSQLCSTFNEQMPEPEMRRTIRAGVYKPHAVRGQLTINGFDCSGKGCCLYLFAHGSLTLPGPTRALFCQIATHLSTAYRLQQRVANASGPSAAGVEAVLKPGGSIENAEGEATSPQARHTLERAVRSREGARGAAGSDPKWVVRGWTGLVAARWTLVDHYERTGHRYILARENAPIPLGPKRLAPREQQICALAALGRSNKLIAYELGLAHSTVRVLLARACGKLGVATRAELIARVCAEDGR